MTMATVIERLLTLKAKGRNIVGIEAGYNFHAILKKEYNGNVPQGARELFCGLPITWNYEIENYQFIEQVAFNF